ncbi:hypothetical protein D1AOALGA4SA_3925 [Olavius algarvensis Delta 1 endosymbiont]|nr:hypothetical protein D1AOALGA4SA_3925 [Olavius algarvensis Delta 1 endosymbiont]
MGIGFRVFLIDEADKIVRISAARFDRLRDRDPKESLLQYKDSRVRYAMVALKLENRKPISILRIDYGYLTLDSEGRLDQNLLDAGKQAIVNMIPSINFPDESSNIIDASDKFAQKRYINEFSWSPTPVLENAICNEAFK